MIINNGSKDSMRTLGLPATRGSNKTASGCYAARRVGQSTSWIIKCGASKELQTFLHH